MEYLSKAGLQYLWGKIRGKFGFTRGSDIREENPSYEMYWKKYDNGFFELWGIAHFNNLNFSIADGPTYSAPTQNIPYPFTVTGIDTITGSSTVKSQWVSFPSRDTSYLQVTFTKLVSGTQNAQVNFCVHGKWQ